MIQKCAPVFNEISLNLGRGSYAVVNKAIYKGQDVAVKLFEKAVQNEELYQSFRKELEIIS
jgi:serine/threonine protein kinase